MKCKAVKDASKCFKDNEMTTFVEVFRVSWVLMASTHRIRRVDQIDGAGSGPSQGLAASGCMEQFHGHPRPQWRVFWRKPGFRTLALSSAGTQGEIFALHSDATEGMLHHRT